MSIDLIHFTPYQALTGGAIIGLAVSVLILFQGKIAGISGILYHLLQPSAVNLRWRAAFLLGLLLSPFIWRLFAALPIIEVNTNTTLLILSGALVGLGTVLGNGCTSGHGICGIARFSKRSIVATCLFMVSGFLTVYIVRHIVGV
ncbi:MAG TPA: YeeE/YedE family protein [Methylophilaceae bacterium]|jgi:hypothetical protein